MIRTKHTARALFAIVAFGAVALSQADTFSVPIHKLTWTQAVSLSKFDPTLGTLTSVKFHLEGTINGSLGMANISTSSANTITGTLSAKIGLLRPDNSEILSVTPSYTKTDTYAVSPNGVPAFDNVHGSLTTVPNTSKSDDLVSTSASDLALFTGPGSINLTVNTLGTSNGTDSAGNAAFLFNTNAGAEGYVEYTYQAVPEPASMAALALGVAAALRRRNRK